jgi:hypothetical protein
MKEICFHYFITPCPSPNDEFRLQFVVAASDELGPVFTSFYTTSEPFARTFSAHAFVFHFDVGNFKRE